MSQNNIKKIGYTLSFKLFNVLFLFGSTALIFIILQEIIKGF